MNLDDTRHFEQLDPQNMLVEINNLPAQLLNSYRLGLDMPLPEFGSLRRILIAGMGGSAIGGDLLAAYAAPSCPLPVVIHRGYSLPAWAQGPETLVVALSHSGNTEETLSGFQTAVQNGCQTLAISTGGNLAAEAARANIPLWRFEHSGQPRAAVGYSFGLLLALFKRLALVPDPSPTLESAVQAMLSQMPALVADVPTVHNPAKRMAGQLYGRWVAIFGSDFLAPVARRWKTQINEAAKAWSQFETLPEADHNMLAGTAFPAEVVSHTMALFLRASSDHPRNSMRSDLTRQSLMMDGFNTDFIDAKGDTPLAHIWTTLHLGDYVAYYLAMAYEIDPTPVEAIENLKIEMGL